MLPPVPAVAPVVMQSTLMTYCIIAVNEVCVYSRNALAASIVDSVSMCTAAPTHWGSLDTRE
jgi:hypothetical protein